MDQTPAVAQDDAALLREALSRALETVNLAEALARRAQQPEVRAYLLEQVRTAKGQIAEGLALLGKQDAEQAGLLRRDEGAPEPREQAAFRAETGRSPWPPPAPPSPLAGTLTVGSLRNR